MGSAEAATPLVHLTLEQLPEAGDKTEAQYLQDIADAALELGCLVSVHRISPLDRWQQRPTLR